MAYFPKSVLQKKSNKKQKVLNQFRRQEKPTVIIIFSTIQKGSSFDSLYENVMETKLIIDQV